MTPMTLARLKEIFNSVSLQHIEIKEFYVGNSFSIAVSPRTKYPIVFMEIPYNISYNDDQRLKTYQFALNILFKVKQDDIEQSHAAMSKAEDIGDQILSKIMDDYKSEILLTGVRALSLDQFSDDYLSGMRYELTVNVNRFYTVGQCYADYFEVK